MRPFLLVGLLAATVASAQEPPAPPVGVERTTLAPGDVKAFRLQPGQSHQLLVPAPAEARDAVTLSYRAANGQSTLVAINRTGKPLGFTVLADPNGTGGFQPAGDMTAPGDGTPAARSWPGMLGRVNVGDFTPAAGG